MKTRSLIYLAVLGVLLLLTPRGLLTATAAPSKGAVPSEDAPSSQVAAPPGVAIPSGAASSPGAASTSGSGVRKKTSGRSGPTPTPEAASILDPFLAGVERRVLPNGITLINREQKGSGVVAIQTLVKAGYFHEPDEVAGMAHLFEHMFFKGSKKFPSAEEMARQISGAGGFSNAGPSTTPRTTSSSYRRKASGRRSRSRPTRS